MVQQLTFSIATMKASKGRSEPDVVYRQWFLDECEKRILVATGGLATFVSGKDPLTESTMAKAAALRAEARLMAYALNECAAWFADKQKLAIPLNKMKSKHDSAFKQAEQDYQRLQGWFN